MLKNLLTIIFLLSISTFTVAQTSVDFTATDCNSVSHNLYTELNAGKVVVISFVMPCGGCIGPTLTAYNISQSYATSNPGQVLFYLADDIADATCTALNGWAASNNIGPNMSVFSTTDLLMSLYGQAGMPKIVVIGGPDHEIYFNENDLAAGNSTAIQAAIDLALSEIVSVSETSTTVFSFSLYPNPVNEKLNLSYVAANHDAITIQIMNPLGEVVNEVNKLKVVTGLNQLSFDTKHLASGIYFVRFSSATGYSMQKFIVE